MANRTISHLQRSGVEQLKAAEIENAGLDARILLQFASGYSHAGLISNADQVLTEETADLFHAFIARRVSGEPTQRILGYCEFYGRNFELSIDTLIPRQDTEILIDAALDITKTKSGPMKILDIGTGTGAIAVTLAAEIPNAEVLATDISNDALRTAQRNASANHVSDRVRFRYSDLFSDVDGKFDLVISNPPYIPSGDLAELQYEVREYDPCLALDGGADGLIFYRRILEQVRTCLAASGNLIVEVGFDQAVDVKGIAKEMFLSYLRSHSDLSGIERVLVFES